jgi:hypothetical protein
VLDEQGVITEKHFEQSYRVRPTARIFEEWAIGTSEAGPPVAASLASSGNVELRAWTDSPTYRPYQQLRLHVELSLPRDTHVFSSSGSQDYTPFSLEVEPVDGLEVGQYELPDPRPFSIEGLDEHLVVYEGSMRAVIPLRLTKNLGPTSLAVRITCQACTSTICFPPAALRLAIPLNGLDLIRD